jgi:hypothetical protein
MTLIIYEECGHRVQTANTLAARDRLWCAPVVYMDLRVLIFCVIFGHVCCGK